MRILFWLLIVLALALGLLFGALNPATVAVDVYFRQMQLPLGGALLSALLIGAMVGGLCLWLMVILPLRAQLRKARRISGGRRGRNDDASTGAV